MKLKKLDELFTVCKVMSLEDLDLNADFCFIGKTDEEISFVCETKNCPHRTTERDDGWKGFRIQGILDFSMIGILSKISAVLAENKIGIFVVSTYNTDYVFVKEKKFEKALDALAAAGHEVI